MQPAQMTDAEAFTALCAARQAARKQRAVTVQAADQAYFKVAKQTGDLVLLREADRANSEAVAAADRALEEALIAANLTYGRSNRWRVGNVPTQ